MLVRAGEFTEAKLRPSSLLNKHANMRRIANKKCFVYHQPLLVGTHVLKIVYTIFPTAKVLLHCVRSSLPALQNYSNIDGIVLPIRKDINGS